LLVCLVPHWPSLNYPLAVYSHDAFTCTDDSTFARYVSMLLLDDAFHAATQIMLPYWDGRCFSCLHHAYHSTILPLLLQVCSSIVSRLIRKFRVTFMLCV